MNTLKDTVQGLAMELGVESPLDAKHMQGDSSPAAHQFALSAAAGRLYIQNAAGKAIEVGDLYEEGGQYGYRLDQGAIQGQGFPDLGAALRHLASQLTFIYVDGLFQQLPDSAAEANVHSMSSPPLFITLADGTDELRGPGGTETLDR
ncbi:hypothetical protein [Bordetella genomosp. 9]|uniref:Uncharacterized protein n=1 Tax=Bordetella genomosp. 9 TaxID=1416803 RepID=A0A1W6Z2A1_9BORD|nr:hypothetical protein [Bordetella genomosp. 9]ARP87507.1 hypothetical protein CAL13_15815 [Bordetella genomosp. 9]ARP91483.1 hypothetical protein CAL14_15310 [Bordetella genomosp. 9]